MAGLGDFPDDGVNGGTGIKYLGEVPHARITKAAPVHMPFGPQTIQAHGYVKGDQVALLPKAGPGLEQLQYALLSAGYLTEAQFKSGVIIPGSPDSTTVGAFAKLLATANLSGVEWKEALNTRLTAAGAAPPEDTSVKTPALTINVSNPDDIKAILRKTSQSILGQYMSDAQMDAFVGQIQSQESAAQTQSYNQQYTPGVGYGPGGTTVNAPTGAGVQAQAEAYAKASDPNQYMATQFGSQVEAQLNSLRTSGYLS